MRVYGYELFIDKSDKDSHTIIIHQDRVTGQMGETDEVIIGYGEAGILAEQLKKIVEEARNESSLV